MKIKKDQDELCKQKIQSFIQKVLLKNQIAILLHLREALINFTQEVDEQLEAKVHELKKRDIVLFKELVFPVGIWKKSSNIDQMQLQDLGHYKARFFVTEKFFTVYASDEWLHIPISDIISCESVDLKKLSNLETIKSLLEQELTIDQVEVVSSELVGYSELCLYDAAYGSYE